MTPPHSAGSYAQRGFSIVTAIFLLVVLAGLGAAMVTVSSISHTTSVLDLQGARAYQAARAGVEWGLFRQFRQNSCTPSTSFALPAGTLQSFTVTVACLRTATPLSAGAMATKTMQATLTLGQPSITVAGDTANLVDGMAVAGPGGMGIPPGTVIVARPGATEIILSLPATANGTQTLDFYSPLDRWTITATACNQPSGGACPNQNNSPDYIQRVVQVQF